jgi:hypothetical protein
LRITNLEMKVLIFRIRQLAGVSGPASLGNLSPFRNWRLGLLRDHSRRIDVVQV